MIKLAICDDQTQELDSVRSYIMEYMEQYQMNIDMYEFKHPDQMIQVCKKEVFQIYLLDIVMPMMDGIELANEIRRHDKEAQIVFVTTEPQYALKAYCVNPLNYLLKPIEKQILFDTLTLAVNKTKDIEDKVFKVKVGNGVRIIKLMEVVYGEYVNHSVSFTLVSGEVIKSSTFSGKFADYITDFFADIHFLQPHMSYIVNMKYVEQFEKDAFLVRGNVRVPISARNYGKIRESYMDYLMGEVHV